MPVFATLTRSTLTTLLALLLLVTPGPRRTREARPVRPSGGRLTRLAPRLSAGEAPIDLSREACTPAAPGHQDTRADAPVHMAVGTAGPRVEPPLAINRTTIHPDDAGVPPNAAVRLPPLRAPPGLA